MPWRISPTPQRNHQHMGPQMPQVADGTNSAAFFIKVPIWSRRTLFALRHTVAVTHAFGNGDVCKESCVLRTHDDIPLVRFVLDKAQTWTLRHVSRIEP